MGPTVGPAWFGSGQPLISANLDSSIALETSMGSFWDGHGGLANPCFRWKPGENILKAMIEPIPGPPAGLRQTDECGEGGVGIRGTGYQASLCPAESGLQMSPTSAFTLHSTL